MQKPVSSPSRISAADVRPGDVISSTRRSPRLVVTGVRQVGVSVWLSLKVMDANDRADFWGADFGADAGRIRPKLTASFWVWSLGKDDAVEPHVDDEGYEVWS